MLEWGENAGAEPEQVELENVKSMVNSMMSSGVAELRIGSIVIERFRAFRELKIEGLGRVNLITGRNNTGKSSVLEALRILASDASASVIDDILRYREEDIGEPEEQTQPIDSEGLFQVTTLFHGYPPLSETPEPIVISTNGGQRPLKLTPELLQTLKWCWKNGGFGV